MPAKKIRSKLSTDSGHLSGRGVTWHWGRSEGGTFSFKKMLRLAHIHNNSLRKQSTLRHASAGFPAKRRLSAEIPYWWRVTTQIKWCFWLVQANFQRGKTNQKSLWRVISKEFLRSSLWRHFPGRPVVTLRNVGCFLRQTKQNTKHIQSPPDNSNLQGKSKESSSYRELEENSLR